MAFSDDVPGSEVVPGQDFDHKQGIDAAGRVIDAARVALERGDETAAEDLLNAIKPPDGTMEASMAVLRSKIRDVRTARRQLHDGVPGAPPVDGAPDVPASPDRGAETQAAPEDVDEALVAWHFVESPAPASGSAPPPKPARAPGPSSTSPAPEAVRVDASPPAPLLFESASAPRPAASGLRWAAVLLGVLVVSAAVYTYVFLR